MTNPDSSQPGGLSQTPVPVSPLPGLCSWDWPMSAPSTRDALVSIPGRVFLELLCVSVHLGECHAVLADVLAPAGQAPGRSEEELRAALMVLADRAARLLEGQTR